MAAAFPGGRRRLYGFDRNEASSDSSVLDCGEIIDDKERLLHAMLSRKAWKSASSAMFVVEIAACRNINSTIQRNFAQEAQFLDPVGGK